MCPLLEIINITYCCNMNIRILLPMLTYLPNLRKLLIKDENFNCQQSEYETIIKDAEWKTLLNYRNRLEKIAIDSCNMTLDIVDYLLMVCPNVSDIILDSDIMNNLVNNIINGTNKDNTVCFRSITDLNKVLKACKPIKFKQLFKDKMKNALETSEFMNKLREKDEQFMNDVSKTFNSMTEEEQSALLNEEL